MSAPASYNPPVPFQKSVISGNLNGTLLTLFCSGGYFGLYIFTRHIYSTKSQYKQRVVTSALTALFTVALGQVILQWYMAFMCFVRKTDTRLDTLYSSLGSTITPVENFVEVIMESIAQFVADGLLIWRCFHVLYQRRYLKLALVCLYIMEVVFILVANIMNGIGYFYSRDETAKFARQYNIFEGTTLCMTATTSIIATFVIGAQIYTSTSLNTRARKRYTHIVEILVQSSALYSLSIVGQAIVTLVDEGSFNGISSKLLNAGAYTYSVSCLTAVFAPTLMVARLTLAKDKATEDYSTVTVPTTADTSSEHDALTPLEGHNMTSSPENKDIISEGTVQSTHKTAV